MSLETLPIDTIQKILSYVPIPRVNVRLYDPDFNPSTMYNVPKYISCNDLKRFFGYKEGIWTHPIGTFEQTYGIRLYGPPRRMENLKDFPERKIILNAQDYQD